MSDFNMETFNERKLGRCEGQIHAVYDKSFRLMSINFFPYSPVATNFKDFPFGEDERSSDV